MDLLPHQCVANVTDATQKINTAVAVAWFFASASVWTMCI